MPQPEHYEFVVLGAGDLEREVLILLIKPVEQRELLRPVRRVVHGIKVEGQRDWRLRERGDELVDEHVAEAEPGGDVDPVLEPGQRRLAGQVRVVGRSAMSLKTGSVRRVSWSFWSA